MDNVYSLDSQTIHPFSGAPMPKQEHQRLMTFLLIGVLVVAIIIGVWYWMSMASNPPSTPAASKQDVYAQMAALLRSEPVSVTQNDLASMSAFLKKNRVNATAADYKMMASKLAH